MRRIIITIVWFLTTISTLTITLFLQKYRANLSIYEQTKETLNMIEDSQKNASYRLYASMPSKVLGSSTSFSIQSKSPIPEIVEKYLKKYKSPMGDYSSELIAAAEKHHIDPLLLVAIAQCESNLGKKMPTDDCYNPFGWGIHSKGTLCFESWVEGFEKVASGLEERYFEKGYGTPEEIMRKYTPTALEKDGSWAKCVNQFLEELKTIE